MSVNFWNDLDSTLASTISADMGAASSYVDYKLAAVQVVDTWDIDVTESSVGDLILPICFIVGTSWQPGNKNDFEPQGPGFGSIKIDVAYSYDLVVATEPLGTYAECLQSIKELVRRLREVIRDNYTLSSLTSTDGETMIEIDIGQAEVEVRGVAGSHFIGGGVLPITVYSEV